MNSRRIIGAVAGAVTLALIGAPATASTDKCSKGIGGESIKIQSGAIKALQKCNDAYRKDTIKTPGNFAGSGATCEKELAKAIGSGGTLDKEVAKMQGFLGKTCTDVDLQLLGHLDEGTFGKRWTLYIGITAVQSALEQQINVARDTMNVLATASSNGCNTCKKITTAPCQEHACTYLTAGSSGATVDLSSPLTIPVPLTGASNLKLCSMSGFGNSGEIIVSGATNKGLQPAPIPGVGFACVKAIGAEGVIGCGSGVQKISYVTCQDHIIEAANAAGATASGACSGDVCLASAADTGQAGTNLSAHPGVINGGACVNNTATGGVAGDAFINNTTQIAVVLNSEVGPDGKPCTNDDTNPSAGTPATSSLTTGTASSMVLDADNQPGVDINSAVVTGAAFNCGNIQSSNLSGAKIVGAFPALHSLTLGQSALDQVTGFTISCN